MKDKTGHVRIPINNEVNNSCVIYARVSSNDRKESLIAQQKRLEEFAISKGLKISKSYKEVASGMNDDRATLNKILENKDWKYLIIENKDRLTRFGFNYIKTLLRNNEKEIIVMNEPNNDKEDLLKDLTAIIYSFSARLYGLRRRRTKKEIINFLNPANENA